MKRLILFVSIVAWSTLLNAQYNPYYNFAIGIRAGSTGATCGGTLKYFVGDASALEAVLGYYKGGVSATLLFEQHLGIFRRKELQMYVGGGGHYTTASDYQNWIVLNTRAVDYRDGQSCYGIDGVIGLEYKFRGAPIAFSMDLKPAIEFDSQPGFTVGIDKSLGVKLAL